VLGLHKRQILKTTFRIRLNLSLQRTNLQHAHSSSAARRVKNGSNNPINFSGIRFSFVQISSLSVRSASLAGNPYRRVNMNHSLYSADRQTHRRIVDQRLSRYSSSRCLTSRLSQNSSSRRRGLQLPSLELAYRLLPPTMVTSLCAEARTISDWRYA